MYIAEDKISDIKNAADIVEIISDYVVLKKTGKNYVGLCPFHSEKTPSFTVNSEKQIFHCFGCGEGGNVFTFLMKKDGLSFPESVRQIGKRYGVEIPEKSSKEKNSGFDEKEILYNINKQATEFFKENLYNSKAGKIALTYLEKRGMKNETIRDFDIGYASDGWNNLLNYFSRKEVSQRIVERAGLIVSRKHNNGYYDRFRSRIMFPIIDMNNRVIGFGGRVLDDSMPKYMNSPETPVFNKGNSLYGLNKAKQQCRDSQTVYIAEGYFDLLALHQHGVKNSVATLGTSLTSEHVQMLRNRYVGENGKVILVYDSDVAGIKAAQRSIEVFKQGYVDAKILVLPDGFDPDSYLFKLGKESFLKIANKASSAMSFLIDSAVNRYGLSIEGKMRIVSDMVGHFVMIEDDVVKSLHTKELAERLGIDETAIIRKMNDSYDSMYKGKRNSFDQRSEKAAIHSGLKKGSTSVKGKGVYEKETRLEKHIISMMLQFPEILAEIKRRDVLKHFQDENLKSIGQVIISKMIYSDSQVSEVLNAIDDMENRNIITSLAIGEEIWNREGCLKLIQQFESSRSRYGD
ncbi:MAG: DNA primase, partial [Desulfobacterales bacterium]|nr:DNA primase [Desulfobacterales bacterium]